MFDGYRTIDKYFFAARSGHRLFTLLVPRFFGDSLLAIHLAFYAVLLPSPLLDTILFHDYQTPVDINTNTQLMPEMKLNTHRCPAADLTRTWLLQ